MSEYLELPWSVEDTINNLKELKDGLQERCIIRNLHGRGEKDAEEIAFDFDRAIKALEEVEQYRAIGTVEKIKEELDHLRNDNDCQGLYFTLEERQDLARQHRELEKYKTIGTPEQCRVAVKFKEYFDELYGNGLEVVNWHQNGDTEPFDNFYESALDMGDEK